MKQKLKSYTFWVALVSAIILVIEEVCKLFGWGVDVGIIENIMLSICGVFVVLGIITKSNSKSENENCKDKTTEDITVENDSIKISVDEVLNLDLDVNSDNEKK